MIKWKSEKTGSAMIYLEKTEEWWVFFLFHSKKGKSFRLKLLQKSKKKESGNKVYKFILSFIIYFRGSCLRQHFESHTGSGSQTTQAIQKICRIQKDSRFQRKWLADTRWRHKRTQNLSRSSVNIWFACK